MGAKKLPGSGDSGKCQGRRQLLLPSRAPEGERSVKQVYFCLTWAGAPAAAAGCDWGRALAGTDPRCSRVSPRRCALSSKPPPGLSCSCPAARGGLHRAEELVGQPP
ncbi:ras-related protein Rab-40B [Platysternon megacephalum]|uniref:Ras-related protein Rab-40B n=1 Tax=Platysternon megacephalum TaxID=55544 RepID=A0A4D9EGT8_9SAUR|nr:ras-related protein Rab-40B [Platysternon megacephalum]